MQIHVTSKGKKQGPFTIYRIKEMIDAGDLSLDDLGWHEGLDKWCPIKDISIITSTLDSLNKKKVESDDTENDGINATVFPYWEFLESEETKTDNTQTDKSCDDSDQASPLHSSSTLPLPSSSPVDKIQSDSASAQNVHPFLRFWARLFDYMLLNIMVWSVFDHPQIPPMPSDVSNILEFLKRLDEMIPREELIRIAMIQSGALFVWNFIEALLISSYGTTPGKMLFNIRVTQKNGTLLTYSEALGRSVLVWFLGIGLGISFLQFMAMTFSLFYLLSKGTTLWDRTLKSQVSHQPLGLQRIVLAIGAYLVLFSLQSILVS